MHLNKKKKKEKECFIFKQERYIVICYANVIYIITTKNKNEWKRERAKHKILYNMFRADTEKNRKCPCTTNASFISCSWSHVAREERSREGFSLN